MIEGVQRRENETRRPMGSAAGEIDRLVAAPEDDSCVARAATGPFAFYAACTRFRAAS